MAHLALNKTALLVGTLLAVAAAAPVVLPVETSWRSYVTGVLALLNLGINTYQSMKAQAEAAGHAPDEHRP